MNQFFTIPLGRTVARPFLVVLLLSLLLMSRSGAATFSVTSTANAGAGSLRQAIFDANADGSATAASPHLITFTVSGTITLSSPFLVVTNHVIIQGPGVGALTLSGGNTTRIFWLQNGAITIRDLTLANGRAKGGDGGGGGMGAGGAIFMHEGREGGSGSLAVRLINLTLTGNSALGGSGVFDSELRRGLSGGGMGGNGVFNDGGGGVISSGGGGNGGSVSGQSNGGIAIFGSGGSRGGFFRNGGGFGGGGGLGEDESNSAGGNGGNGGFGGGGGNGGSSGNEEGERGGNGGNGGFGGGGGIAGVSAAILAGKGGNGGFGGGGVGIGQSGFGGGSELYPRRGGMGAGGAIFVTSGSLTMSGVTLTNNLATGGTGQNAGLGLGGAIFIFNKADNGGNAAPGTTNDPVVYACGLTFSGNTAGNQGNQAGSNDNNQYGSFAVNPPATRLYVKAGATGANTGLDWENAFSSLQSALTYPCSQNLTEIWVAAGTYKPTTTTGPASRTISFAMKNGVAIYGGFPNTGNPTLADRNPASFPTVLSGDIGTPNDNSDNSFHVISNPPGINNTALLDGFVITGGNANSSGDNNFGGGMLNNGRGSGNVCSPSLTNCAFQRNTANSGGAMFNYGEFGSSSPVLTNCAFLGNTANSGGAMYNFGDRGSSSPVLTNCAFQENTANSGGAMVNFGGEFGSSSPTLTNCALQGNTARSNGGAMANSARRGGNSSPTLTNCTFQGNTANSGGAMDNSGFQGSINPVLTNCILFGNGGSTFFNFFASGATATYSLFDNTDGVNITGPGNLTTTISPFVSATDLRLTACSPAINVGTNSAPGLSGVTTDLAGNPRNVGGTVDMGAYEFQTTPNFPVAITQQPAASSVVCAGGAVTVAVSVTGTVSGYQWYKDGALLSPAQSTASLSLPSATTADAGSYSVVVTGACNSLTSTVFSLTVNSPIGITAQPPTQSAICAGGAVTAAVSVTGTGPLTYQWYRNGAIMTGNTSATTAALSIPSATVADAGSYSVVVMGACNSLTSKAFSLTVNSPIGIIQQPAASSAVCAGGAVTVSVSATGTGPLTYRWYKDGTELNPAQTLASLNLTNVQSADAGSYLVVVTGACNSLTTTVFSLTVNAPPAPPTLSANSRTVYASALLLNLTPFVVATANTLSFSGLSGALPNPPTANVSQAGQQVYRVSQTNTNGCVSGATSFTLTVLSVSPVSQTVCRSSRVELVAGAFGSRYEWYKNGQSAPFKLTEIASIQRGTATSSLTLVSVQTPASYYCKVFGADGGFVFTGPFLVAVNYGCIAPRARQAAGAEVAAEINVAEGGLQVLVSPNPVVGSRLQAEVSGAEGQALRVSLIDSRGRSVGHQEWSSAGASEVVDWDMSQRPAGVYVLRAVSGSLVGVVRVVKAE